MSRRAIIIPDLECGGAQRIATIAANHWFDQGHHVTVITLAPDPSQPFFPMRQGVDIVNLGQVRPSLSLFQAIAMNIGRISTLRKALRNAEADVAVSFLDTTNVLTLLASRGLSLPVAVMERSNPAMHRIGWIWETLRRWTYPMADAIGVQTNGARDYFPAKLHERIRVIQNPIERPAPGETSPDVHQPTILAVGRFSEVKRFELLIRVFAHLVDRHPDWHLTLVGDGPERIRLESVAREHGLGGAVHFPGFMETAPFFVKADIVALTSSYEGFPNAMLEAMSHGVPVVSFDCPHGPREIFEAVPGGVLVEDGNEEQLVSALSGLMGDEAERTRLGTTARQVNETYSKETIMAEWETMIREMERG